MENVPVAPNVVAADALAAIVSTVGSNVTAPAGVTTGVMATELPAPCIPDIVKSIDAAAAPV